ncbi:MAG TPA: PIG-L family deacetylase [bacterium]|nr:PIG-L family deacetylase [bacterium]
MKRGIMGFAALLLMAGAALARVPEGDLLDGVSPGADGRIDVAAVFAHPDDESFYVGGTLIKLKEDPRVRLHILCLTIGDQDRAKDKLGIPPERLGEIRVKELMAAGNALGADEVIEAGYPDQGLESADYAEVTARVASFLETAGAEIVITHDPYGISGHPDHVTCSKAATEAFKKSPAQRLYYVTMPPARYTVNSWFSLLRREAPRAVPTIRVNIRAEKQLKKLALYSHASQKSFSFWNGLAMYEDLIYNHEYFAEAGEK